MSDLHLPQKMIIFAVGKVTMCFPFFSCLAVKGLVRCVKMRCNLRQVTLSSASSCAII